MSGLAGVLIAVVAGLLWLVLCNGEYGEMDLGLSASSSRRRE